MHRKTNSQLKWLSVVPALLLVLYFVFFLYQKPAAPVDTGQDVTSDVPEIAPEILPAPAADPAAIAENQLPALEAEEAEEAIPAESAQTLRDREFISYAFPVLSSWNVAAVKPLLADATVQASSDEELNEVMSVLSGRLGGLESFETPVPMTEGSEADNPVLTTYRFVAYYEAGEAEVNLVLHREMDANSLYSFNIHVPN